MALLFTGSSVTADETADLQNLTSSVASIDDANDNDIAMTALPAAFQTRLTQLGAGTPIETALSGYSGAIGNTGEQAVTYDTTGPAEMFFSDASGALLSGQSSGLITIGGDPIALYTDSEDNNILLGKDPGGAIVFSAYLEESTSGQSGAKIWLVQYEPLRNPDALNPDDPVNLADLVYVTLDQGHESSLENAPAGQNLFVMFGNTEVAVIASGLQPANQSEGESINTGDTINTSNAAGSVAIGVNNQMVNPNQGIYFTFVTGANSNYLVPDLSETEADVESNISFTDVYDARSALFHVVQLQGDKAATVRITAFHTDAEPSAGFVDGLADADDIQVGILSVIVRDAAGNDVSGTVSIESVDGVITITGVGAGYSISYETADNHNRLKVENVGTERGSTANFDIDGFHLTNATRETTEIGSALRFEDDGPSIALSMPLDTGILNTQDADTAGTDFDTDTQNFSGAFGIASQSFGTDGTGAAPLSWEYGLSVATQGVNSDLTTHGDPVYLYLLSGKVIGSTAASEAAVTSENTVFDVSVTATGSLTLSQYSAIDHPTPGSTADYASQLLTLGNGKVSLTGTATIVDADGDTTSDQKTLDLGGNLAFNDDGPAIELSNPSDTLLLNTQDALTIGSDFDTDSGSFADALTIVANSYGADGTGYSGTNWDYTLDIQTQGVESGLSSNSATIRLFQLPSGVVVGSIAESQAEVNQENTIFDLSVDAAGSVTLNQYAQINHSSPGDDSDFEAQTVSLADGLVSLTATATIEDYDGDRDGESKTIDLGGNIVFSDHGPSANTISNLSGPNVADPIYGTYDFSVGADLVNNDEPTGIVLQTLSGTTANGRPISATSVTWESETDTLVNYSFAFKYYASPEADSLQDGSGIVVFNKTDGTYMFDISSALAGEVTYSTSTPLESFYYDTLGNKSPEIVVQKYGDDFYGVLTGQASSPPSKTETLVSGGNLTYSTGETFSNQPTAYVNVATDTLGVNSDTVQAGELLNFDFYTSNPVSGAVSPPQRGNAAVDPLTERATADELDITLSQFNSDEDLLVPLKLWDANSQTSTTKLLIADSSSDFASVDGYKVVHIGTEDYDSDTYDIVGLQILSSSEMMQGTGYRLSDGSTKTLGPQGSGYQDTADLDVFKIIRIDITHQEVTHYDADLLFSGEVIDRDDDFDGFSFSVHLEADGIVPLDQDFLPGSLTIVDPFSP